MAGYVLDTNVYVDANRDPQQAHALAAFVGTFVASVYLSAVVVQELLAGAISAAAARRLQADVIDPYEGAGRVITPSYQSFKRTGRVVASMIRSGVTLATAERGFLNDILLATSCLELNLTLVTRNARDFKQITRYLPGFAFVLPYPAREAT